MHKKNRNRDISVQPTGGNLEGRNQSERLALRSGSHQFMSGRRSKAKPDYEEFDLTIQAESEFKCTRNGCILEVVDIIHVGNNKN